MNARNEDGEGDAEGHAADDEHGIHRACHAGGDKAVQHIARRIDGRKAGHEEDGTRDESVPHSSEAKRGRDHPCEERCDKCCNHCTGIWVECIPCTHAVCDKSHECCNHRNQRLKPAAAEELARSAGTNGSTECDAPVRIAEGTLSDAIDCALDRGDRSVSAQDAPCELADGGDDGEIYAVLHALAELRKGAFAITDTEHECCIGDV